MAAPERFAETSDSFPLHRGRRPYMVTSVNAINATLYDKLSFNLIRDIAPVASIHREPFLVEVNPSVPVKTVPELIAYATPAPEPLGAKANRVRTKISKRAATTPNSSPLRLCNDSQLAVIS